MIIEFSYSRRNFSWLPPEVSKIIINTLSQKLSYSSMIINLDNNAFSPNEVRSHLYIYDNTIITFGKICLCLVFQTLIILEV